MCLDCPAIHPHDICNFRVAAALQEQVHNLLLPRTQPHGPSFIHVCPPRDTHHLLTPLPPKFCGSHVNYL